MESNFRGFRSESGTFMANSFSMALTRSGRANESSNPLSNRDSCSSAGAGFPATCGSRPEATRKAAFSAELKPRLEQEGAEPIGNTPEEFAKLLREDVAKYAEAVRISGAEPE